MKKLVHVVRGIPDRGFAVGIATVAGDPLNFRRHPEVVPTRSMKSPRGDDEPLNYQTEAEFFLVEENDITEAFLNAMTAANPGREVRVYGLEQVAQCPAGAMVTKKVNAAGVLPN